MAADCIGLLKKLQKVERPGDKKTFKWKLEGKEGASHERSGEKGLPGRRREHHVQRPWGGKGCGMCERLSFLSPQPREYLKSINKKGKTLVLPNVSSERVPKAEGCALTGSLSLLSASRRLPVKPTCARPGSIELTSRQIFQDSLSLFLKILFIYF